MNIRIRPVRSHRLRHSAPLFLFGALGLGGLGIAVAGSCAAPATSTAPSALLIEVARSNSLLGGAGPGPLRYSLGDLRSSDLALIGQELELGHKFLRSLEPPQVVIRAGSEISYRELGRVLDEILRRGLSRVEIERPGH